MRLPKERIVFVVDLLPVGRMPGRGMIDFYPLEAEDSIKQILAMDWERLIPGHPGAGGRLGTKKDAQDQLTFLQDASAEMKKLGQAGQVLGRRSRRSSSCRSTRAGRATRRTCRSSAALLRAVGPRHVIAIVLLQTNGPLARAARIAFSSAISPPCGPPR